MNERIKEIFDRSNEESIADWKKGIRYQTSYEKFAELIVRECADVADLADENKCEWIGGNILTYFGVKE
jgi:hypothetical protein